MNGPEFISFLFRYSLEIWVIGLGFGVLSRIVR